MNFLYIKYPDMSWLRAFYDCVEIRALALCVWFLNVIRVKAFCVAWKAKLNAIFCGLSLDKISVIFATVSGQFLYLFDELNGV